MKLSDYNDTLAISGIILITCAGVLMKDSNVVAAGLGGLVGYIGGTKATK